MRTPSLWRARRLPGFRLQPDEFFNQFAEFMDEFDTIHTPTLRAADTDFTPAVDFEDHGSFYLLTGDLPGLKKEDIKIELADGVLSISGQRTREKSTESAETGAHYYERSHGHFMRTFTLPGQVDAEKINAAFENGVLRVTLPKSEATRGREIKVQ
ncbi:Spore protein SP21 [compost metagenome]